MGLKAVDVFTPGSFPEYTYVVRAEQGLEQSLRDSLETTGQIVSISGPSKSGKTVLVEKVVGQNSLITVTGASIRTPDDLWQQVLDWMDVPTSTSVGENSDSTKGVEASVKGGFSVPFLGKAEIGTTGTLSTASGHTTGAVRNRRGLQQVVAEIADSSFVILIDDFHYMPRDVQTEVAKSLKEAVRLKLKIVTASVSHRGDDVVRANPELRGRVRAIDLGYWSSKELCEIATTGFSKLNASFDPAVSATFASESAGSPQLMQLLCLEACFVTNLREEHQGIIPAAPNLDSSLLKMVLEQTSSRTDFRSLVDVLDSGPPTRGTKRTMFTFHDGTTGDVYRVVLKAVASNPPQLSFTYDELLIRTAKECVVDSPVGSSVTSTCVHMAKLATEKFPNDQVIDWDDSKPVLDLPNPYFMFYLRWSGRLHTPQRAALSQQLQDTSAEASNLEFEK